MAAPARATRRAEEAGGGVAKAAESAHAPVLLEAVVAALAVRPDGVYVDATYGRGGHADALLAGLNATGRLVVVDRDPEAVADAKRRLGDDPRVTIHHGTFERLTELVGAGRAHGILLDLGVSSPQLDDPSRGFSFLRDGPLDMRMDPGAGPSAAEFVATASEREITTVIAEFGEERLARRIAGAIVAARTAAPITTTGALAALVAAAVPARRREPGKHPATRTFQALRIAVNRELELLELALDDALEALALAGRLVVISFHSLEDRRVKRFMRRHAAGDPVWRGLPGAPAEARPRLALVGKAQRADAAEVARNPRARSAVLRVAEKVRA
jgi:16S rRNA (cytosine1402-N4)-methyltransferase